MSLSLRGPRPSPALIVAALGLVLALGGTAIAAPDFVAKKVTKSKVRQIAKKQINKAAPGLSVDHATTADTARPTGAAGGDLTGTYPNPQIGNQKVITDKIADAAVTTDKIADNAVTAQKLIDAAVESNKIADDAVTSAKIAPGSVSATDVASIVTRSAVDANVPNGDNGVAVANCLGNEVMLSGGAFWNAATTGNKGLQASFPLGSQAWVGIGRNQSGTPQTFNVQVVCLSG